MIPTSLPEAVMVSTIINKQAHHHARRMGPTDVLTKFLKAINANKDGDMQSKGRQDYYLRQNHRVLPADACGFSFTSWRLTN